MKYNTKHRKLMIIGIILVVTLLATLIDVKIKKDLALEEEPTMRTAMVEEIIDESLEIMEEPVEIVDNRETTKVEFITYKQAYSMEDNEYMVLFTNDKCTYCIDLWDKYIEPYKLTKEKTPLYVVDLGVDTNGTAWADYDIVGIPLLVKFSSSMEKYVGLKEIEQVMSEMIQEIPQE